MQKNSFKLFAKLFTVLLLAIGSQSHAQDIVKVRNINYTSYFSKSQHIPVLVIYSLTPDMFNCSKLKGDHTIKLAEDPQLPEATNLVNDYKTTLFEEGHMMAPNENNCDKDAYAESYFFTNIMPMPSNLYQSLWEKLHQKEMLKAKKYKKVKVFAGTVGRNWVIGYNHNVIVPEWCWKVIYIPSTDEYLCYQFHNIEPYNEKDNLANHKVDINTIESLAGVRFVNGIISASYVTATPNN